MKTLLINGSPKKKRSVSGFFLDMESFFTGGERIKETLQWDMSMRIIREWILTSS